MATTVPLSVSIIQVEVILGATNSMVAGTTVRQQTK